MSAEKKESGISNAELAAIRAYAKEPIVTTNLEGIVTYWNPAAERLFGYTAQEILGKSSATIIPEENRVFEDEILNCTRRGERTVDYETRRLHKDGRIVEVALTSLPIADSTGLIAGVLCIFDDLGPRKRLELAERDQLFLGAIVSSAYDAIVSKDLNGIVTSWNKGAQRLFGYTAEEMIGRPVATLVPPDHPDEEHQILQRIRRGERIEHYDTKRRRKDGQIIDVSVTISPIRDRLGRIVGASKIARDITERKRWEKAEIAESFLGVLIDSAEDAIIGKNLDGIVTSWNRAAEKLFGYTAAEIIGKPITVLFPEDHPDEETQILRRIRRGERIEHYQTKRKRKDGKLIDVAQTISPIQDGLGRIIGASNITHDVTEEKRREQSERDALQQAQEARRRAEEASRAKDDFLATVSHELRTPMTAIMGWSRMLMTGQLTPERLQQAIQTIDRNAQAQAQLIEDLLDISRIVSGRLRIEFKPVDLTAVILAAVEAVRPAAEAKRIRIQSVLNSGAGPILGDAQRLQQVVWNLLSNSIRYTPKEGSIEIHLRRIESQVELQVTDTGVGIGQDFLPHLFERFTQADTSITRSSSGLGMGLAIVKNIVELHGGVVSGASEGTGKGATFLVKLPISAVRPQERHPEPAQLPILTNRLKESSELVGLKILVVEDDPDTCELMRIIFDETGAIVKTARSAEEALLIFDTWNPDILVSDVGMPEVDGYELIRIIREERQSRIPAVALTAMARIEDRLKALSAGFQMHVPKPVEPVELVTLVTSLASLVNRPSSD